MRTRSQPASPGGFVSLETEPTTSRRVTRSTRSASRTVSQESSSQQATEPSTQAAPLPKSQRKIKKPVSRKTAATTTSTAPSDTTSSTATTTKTQTRKAPKRGSRKTTRKAQKATSDETESNAETIIESTGENEDGAANGVEISKSDKSDKALLEPDSSYLNRKRAHSQASPEDDAEPSTLSANKRRNLGTPRSTPFRRTTLSRRLPNIPVSYSERQLRRRTESQGRITRTIFRLPQLVAQNEADRLAAESSAPASPSPGPLQVIPEFSVEQALNNDQITPEKPAAAQEPSTPESTNSRWNIRGLLNSVPRSFSRFLPSFARTPAQAEALVPQQPSSERVQRTRATEAVSTDSTERELQPRRRLSEQLSAQRTRNLSYSLFPPPIDRSLYLGDIPKATAKTSSSALETTPVNQSEHEVLDAPEPQESATPILHERSRDRTPHVTPTAKESQKEKKKRKRSPSPDVIPNPVGSSYGMDLDYFCYSSESEDEDTDTSVPQTEPKKPDTLAKTALRSSVQSERPASKKVRFDASPEDTPSRRRARATDPYTGIHFIGMGNPQPSTTPTTPTPQQPIADPTQQPGFIPNRSGTFQLDYDAFSDDSDSSGAPSPPSTPAPASVIQTPTFMQPTTPENAQPSTPRTTARAVQPMPTPAKVDEEALARARSQAEKYKPKTPSGLRTASRYSSPLTAPTPDATPAPAVEKIAEQFGDDQFAQDAQWLYEHCPSGDLSQLVWPQPTSLAETLGISDEAVRIMSEVWDESQVDEYYPIFQQGVEELKQTLAL
ncbi:hypothetical protein BJX63DRAFT_383348 [Aspergillus granulosus]|uniref:Uncharacterized protein n=1 Tax=Aspergillus granulosus TaxID=176169 RepID=A0ABR4HTZ8_9EURO